jgi:spore germination protein YaaH
MYDRAAMGARNPARYLAPIALLATITATYLIVNRGLANQHSTTVSQTSTVRPTPSHKLGGGRFYVVRPGDSLSVIASKAGVSLSTLQSLNPGVNPNALQVGQRLTLRR